MVQVSEVASIFLLAYGCISRDLLGNKSAERAIVLKGAVLVRVNNE
jgi:hypothetical protein